MPRTEIKPRQIVNHGNTRWRIIVPKSMRGQEGKSFYFFDDEAKAITKAEQLTKDRDKVGAGFHALSQQDQALVLEAVRRVNGDVRRLLLAVDKLDNGEKSALPRLIRTVVDECVKEKQTAGLRPKYLINFKSSLNKFAVGIAAAGDGQIVNIGQVTAALIQEWVTSQGWAPPTRKTYIDHVGIMCDFAVKRGYISTNPALGVSRPKLEDKPPGIHKVTEVKALLKAALKYDKGLLGYLCPVYFGGLRPAEAARLAKEDVKAELIEVTPAKAKTRNRRFSTINPTLKEWLAVRGVQIGPKNIRRRLHFIRSKVKKLTWSHDVMRHTFCSYALPKFGAKDTAAWAGHSEQILFAHYRERVKPKEVELFWAITPKSLKK